MVSKGGTATRLWEQEQTDRLANAAHSWAHESPPSAQRLTRAKWVTEKTEGSVPTRQAVIPEYIPYTVTKYKIIRTPYKQVV